MQAEPVAGPEFGDAAGDPVGRRAALRKERAPADAPLDGIVPAVERRVGLVEDEGFDGGWQCVHLRPVAKQLQALIRRHSPSRDGRPSTPYGATFSRKREKGTRALSRLG